MSGIRLLVTGLEVICYHLIVATIPLETAAMDTVRSVTLKRLICRKVGFSNLTQSGKLKSQIIELIKKVRHLKGNNRNLTFLSYLDTCH